MLPVFISKAVKEGSVLDLSIYTQHISQVSLFSLNTQYCKFAITLDTLKLSSLLNYLKIIRLNREMNVARKK